MFGNMGLWAHKFPSGKFGFVGSIPTALGTQVKANTAAVMGGRAFENEAGEIVEWKFPVFDTLEAAVAFAASKGFETKVSAAVAS
jgi:hypothetical protein